MSKELTLRDGRITLTFKRERGKMRLRDFYLQTANDQWLFSVLLIVFGRRVQLEWRAKG